MTRTIWLAALAAVCVLVAAPATAHPVPFSYLDLRLQPQSLDATLVLHIFDVGHDLHVDPPDTLLDPAVAGAHARELGDLVARRLRISADGRPLDARWTDVEVLSERQSLRLHARFALDRPPGTVAVSGTMFPYDSTHRTFVNVYEGAALTQAVIDERRTTFEYYAGSRQGALAIVRKFIPAGVEHILIGPDHMLFLVGLLLLGGSIRRLALIVTGFTVAHSLTLALAALNIFSPPARVIEPAIALSIVYVGADNLLIREGRDLRVWIAFAFGFIHGFGFANVLREMDLPARALGWSLFSFNVGVEIGQLIIVAVIATALAALRVKSEAVGRRLAFAGSIAVIAVGTFWFIQRIATPGGR
ncbi:MAG TPA: HupE/UreJ family protein [Vicinamibacterales bacterium]|nr:HupE/UreJ family protein [Vicinamibacterales bacterium]